MDKLKKYRSIVRQVLMRYAALQPSLGDIATAPLFDETNDQYLVLDYGWDSTGRVHNVSLHVRLEQGKVWIEVDNTEEGITQELLARGVARTDIVLAFYRLERRKLTDYAAA